MTEKHIKDGENSPGPPPPSQEGTPLTWPTVEDLIEMAMAQGMTREQAIDFLGSMFDDARGRPVSD